MWNFKYKQEGKLLLHRWSLIHQKVALSLDTVILSSVLQTKDKGYHARFRTVPDFHNAERQSPYQMVLMHRCFAACGC
jgi:hypothetical protein